MFFILKLKNTVATSINMGNFIKISRSECKNPNNSSSGPNMELFLRFLVELFICSRFFNISTFIFLGFRAGKSRSLSRKNFFWKKHCFYPQWTNPKGPDHAKHDKQVSAWQGWSASFYASCHIASPVEHPDIFVPVSAARTASRLAPRETAPREARPKVAHLAAPPVGCWSPGPRDKCPLGARRSNCTPPEPPDRPRTMLNNVFQV